MKFTSMQSALALGALSAVAVPALADNATGAAAELVLYVVNTANNTAYSRGLQININDICGSFSASGYTTAFTGSLCLGNVNDIGVVTAEAVAHGYAPGAGSQNVLSIGYTLPSNFADTNLTNFLANGNMPNFMANGASSNFKWSIQGGVGAGTGSNFSRRFVTTAIGNYENGTDVTASNLGMSATEANVWADITSMVLADNAINTSTTIGDGTSISNSTYLSYLGAGGGTANTWFSSNPNNPQPLNSFGSIGFDLTFQGQSNLYAFVSSGTLTSKDWVFTLNDTCFDAYGNGANWINEPSCGLYHNPNFHPPVAPIPASVWLLISSIGGLGLFTRKRKA